MKKNLILFVTVFALAVFLVIAFASSDFAVPDGYDPVEERVKHGLTYDYKELGLTYDCRAIEEDTEGPWDFPPDDSFDEETGSREYRLADKQTAELLRRVCEEREGAARAQHYYDITVSFEKADRIEAMYKMLEVYDAASVEEKRCFDWYMSSYAPFAGDDVLLEKVNKISWDNRDVSRTYNRSYGYNRGAAARWAYDHYDSYSPDFPNLSYLGGDCANFVSQCMHVGGGMQMENEWYCLKKNSAYPEPKTVHELDYSWALANPSPWISAKFFFAFWSAPYRSTLRIYDLNDYKNGNTGAFVDPIYVGHAVSLLKRVLWWHEAAHTMIIVGYDFPRSDYVVAAHSRNTRTKRIKDVADDYSMVAFYSFK